GSAAAATAATTAAAATAAGHALPGRARRRGPLAARRPGRGLPVQVARAAVGPLVDVPVAAGVDVVADACHAPVVAPHAGDVGPLARARVVDGAPAAG